MNRAGRRLWLRPEALLLGLLIVKLSLSCWSLCTGAWEQAVAAEGQPPAISRPQAAMSDETLLARQREELNRREERLQRREAEVAALASEVEAKLDQLNAVQARIKEDMRVLTENKGKARAKQIKQLVQVYTSMKAEKAASLIDKLDEQVVVEVFAQMPSDAAGKILSFVAPEKAARISQRLADLH